MSLRQGFQNQNQNLKVSQSYYASQNYSNNQYHGNSSEKAEETMLAN